MTIKLYVNRLQQLQSRSLLIYYHKHYKPSVRITDLVSHTVYVVYVNVIHKFRDLQSKVDSERQIFFEKLFMAIIFSLRVFARALLTLLPLQCKIHPVKGKK